MNRWFINRNAFTCPRFSPSGITLLVQDPSPARIKESLGILCVVLASWSMGGYRLALLTLPQIYGGTLNLLPRLRPDSRAAARSASRRSWLPHVKKLDDDLGDFIVWVTCPCGASLHIERGALARLVGRKVTLAALATRRRCSQCGKRCRYDRAFLTGGVHNASATSNSTRRRIRSGRGGPRRARSGTATDNTHH